MSTRLGVGILCSVLGGCSWSYHVEPAEDVGAPDTAADGTFVETDAADTPVDTPIDTNEVCTGAICSGTCVDTTKDPAHCGDCGKACAAAEACIVGKCVPCSTGRIRCGTECVDVSSDVTNCGACDSPCGPSAKCLTGACVCDSGTTMCGKKCSDLTKDPDNCGACGAPCAKGWGCFAAKCEEICLAPTTKCAGICVDTSTDPANCGGCAKSCIGAEDCIASACVCKSGLTKCGAACVDTSIDASNCGTCGTTCTTLEACTAGACVCTSGLTKCAGTCVDTTTDKSNCGGCGVICGASELCTASACKPFITYSQAFTSGATPSTQCTAWNTFRAAISATSVYTKLTIKGSLDTTGVTCTAGSANTLCQALKTGVASAAITCGARVFRVGTCGTGVELNANNNMCTCSVGYTVRPCIGNLNWGGVNSNSCSAPTQTMTVTCE